MQHKRRAIREHNIYEWAGNLIAKLCELRIENVENESTRLGASAA
jgi:antitoxin component HigA of HigAB toxin-antitoxin module